MALAETVGIAVIVLALVVIAEERVELWDQTPMLVDEVMNSYCGSFLESVVKIYIMIVDYNDTRDPGLFRRNRLVKVCKKAREE
jgi:hypothetical protein